jgi:hypothetical protein
MNKIKSLFWLFISLILFLLVIILSGVKFDDIRANYRDIINEHPVLRNSVAIALVLYLIWIGSEQIKKWRK